MHTAESATGKPGLRGDIQGMRAVAVVLVVLGHAGLPWFPGGYVGVDVFFVISGFLITGILARSLRTTGRISLTDFYARRARRILPAATVALVATCLGSVLVYSEGRLSQVLDDTVWAALFGANIDHARAGTGYFDTDTFVSPVQHFWSLAVEEQFYLAWPLLLGGCVALAALVLRRLGPVRTDRVRTVGLRFGVLLVAFGSLASLLWSIHRTDVAPTMSYFSTFTRAHELGIGALLALIAGALPRIPARVRAAMSWVGMLAIGVAAVRFTDATAFPGTAALLPVLGAALVVAGGAGGAGETRHGAARLLGIRPLRWVGDISYSLYLWHWPCLILPAAYLARDLRPLETVVAVTVALMAAAASHRWVEEPFRRSTVLSRRRLRALVLWPVAVGLVLATVGAVQLQQEWQRNHEGGYAQPDVDPEPDNRQTSTDPLINDVGFAAELARASEPLPDALHPALTDLLADVTPLSGYDNKDYTCYAQKSQETSKVCTTGAADGKQTIVALGDSHMGMWLAPITRVASQQGMKLVPLLKQRCLPFDVLQYEADLGRPYDECSAHTAWAERKTAELRPDVIVVSALYFTDLVDPESRQQVRGKGNTDLFEQGLRPALARLSKLADRVVLIGPTPFKRSSAADCLASRRATMGTCKRRLTNRLAERDEELRTAAAATGVTYLSPLPWFCDSMRTCPLVVRDRIVYRDDTHITQTYALRLEPVFKAVLTQ